jgi:hypothetical protein
VRFLRHSKYSTVRATDELKYYLSCPKKYPEYFGYFDVREPKLFEMLDSNVAHLMPDIDADGCRIFIFRMVCLDTENVTFVESQKLLLTLCEIAANMEEVQIAGMKIIVDLSNVSIKLFKWPTLKDYKKFGELLQNPFWFRLKAFYILNLPSFGFHISNFLLKFTSEKMKKRIKFIRDKSELKDHIDVNLLTQDYDGKVSIEECRKFVNKLLNEMQDKILLLNKIDADFENIDREATASSEFEYGSMGSFRKLEID